MDAIKLKHGIWVLVADGEKALLLKNAGDNKFPNLEVVQVMEQENPPTREQGSDSPGRYNDGPSVHRSAVEDTDWHRIGKERFAEEIAARLYKLAHGGEFDSIVLVAPPVMLGAMRKKLHKVVGDKVTAEIPKTMTNHAIPEIEAMLQAA
ncbi:baeRF12 domain-containing protein [Mesorhizobium sp. 113-3-3]|uniref:baeRF12 domain-containing protein n=1 Tax=Mesorhizobium sp. 113-3-3 TaxID=2744516 RepID=UPI001925E972|nr:host attachment protein [Mesorhizobium sp. 113-3-3]BCG78301.1 host attachment protein [Mesorhizobium sp. 113-3-3]